MSLRRRGGPQGLPDPERGGPRRRAAGLPRQRGTSQKPRQVHRRDARVLRAAQRQRRTAAIHTLGRRGDRALRGRPGQGRGLHRRADPREVVFTKNSTEALNLVAHVLGDAGRVGPGDEVVITEMEHHSNIVPWQLPCERTGATLRWIGLTDDGRLDLADLDEVINERTKVVVVRPPVQHARHDQPGRARSSRRAHAGRRARRARRLAVRAAPAARRAGARRRLRRLHRSQDVRPDRHRRAVGPLRAARGAAAVPRRRRDDRDGHDGRLDLRAPPHRFEAGTPPIAQAVGLGAAVDYLTDLGMDAIARARARSSRRTRSTACSTVAGLRIIGPTTTVDRGAAIVSFTLDGIHPHDVGQLLDEQGIAVRVGHHCARPVCLRYGVPATTRASLHLYTDDRRDRRAGRRPRARAERFFG